MFASKARSPWGVSVYNCTKKKTENVPTSKGMKLNVNTFIRFFIYTPNHPSLIFKGKAGWVLQAKALIRCYPLSPGPNIIKLFTVAI